ncbi:cytochrome P450 2C15-like [Bufo gargarizans]|uniref:cytochrome P450 2C15-like n=1 Tax=Bufo gargarizans TaxID=30331 RepID=UPI001CF12F87|nr:cytochrome P450 2C15-like [Bufo gargarizans]
MALPKPTWGEMLYGDEMPETCAAEPRDPGILTVAETQEGILSIPRASWCDRGGWSTHSAAQEERYIRRPQSDGANGDDGPRWYQRAIEDWATHVWVRPQSRDPILERRRLTVMWLLVERGIGFPRDDKTGFPSIDGERWRQLRRFTITSLRNFGMGKTSMERRVLEESENLIRAVTKIEGKPFNALNLLGCAVGNITSCALLGEHFDYNDPKLQELIITTRRFIFNTHSPLHELGNTFPFLLNIPILKEKIFKESSKLISFVKKYIEQHRKSLDPSAPRDFIDYFLLKIKEEEARSGSNFSETSLLMTLIALLAAGTETTTSTLNFALNVISNYPEVQGKVQQEIDEVTGSQRPPGIMDRAQMPYTNAVIHEVQRIMDLAPVAHYHAVTKETHFRGYTIPKGTTVIPFISSVLSDPTQWETPEDFNPGHFLDEKGQFRLRSAFMAFSAGKRICAGENLARMELFLLFTSLLQKFTLTLPPGTEPQDCRKLKQNKFKTLFLSHICAEPRSSTA